MNTLKLIWCVIFLGAALVSSSQEINSISFNEAYDFPEKTVYSIAQSENGHVWFGTTNGLYAFDGKDVKRFINEDYDIEYSNIKVDAFNRVWCSNFAGQLFYLEDDSLKVAVKKAIDKTYISNYFIKSENEVIYTSREKRIMYKNLATQKDSVVYYAPQYGSITSSLEVERGFVFFLTRTLPVEQGREVDLSFFDFEENRPKKQLSFSTELLSSKYFASFTKGQFLYVQVSRQQNIHFVSQEKKLGFVLKDFGMDVVNSYITLNDTSLFMLGVKGIYDFKVIGDSLVTEKWSSISNASDMMKDREGNTWVTTLDKGVYIQTNMALSREMVSPSESIMKLRQVGNDFFYVTDKGRLYRVNAERLTESQLLKENLNPNFSLGYNPYNKELVFPSKNERYLIDEGQFKGGALASYFKSIWYIDQYTYLMTAEKLQIASTKPGFDERQLKYTIPLDNIGKGNHFEAVTKSSRCDLVIEESNKQHLYVNYLDGLKHYDDKGNVQRIEYNEKPIYASAITIAGEKGVWVAAISGKLHLVMGGQVTQTFSIGQRATHLVANDSLVYVQTVSDIIRYNVLSGEHTVIDECDGVLPADIVNLMLVRDALWLVGQHYIYQLPLSYKKENELAPSIAISQWSVNETDYPLDKPLFLSHDQNNVEFHFSSVSIKSHQNLLYKYRIQELSPEWETATYEAPYVRYAQLSPGSYTLQVRAVNEDGISSPICQAYFEIDQPMHKKWWFMAIVGIGIIALVAILLVWRLRVLRRQDRLEKEKTSLQKDVYRSKITAIQSQMNPHFMFNALNSIQEFIVTNQGEVASEFLADFADLMRRYLNQSKQTEITLQEEIETMSIYLSLENLRFDNELEYTLHGLDHIDTGVLIPVMMLQPFVENAIKHGLLHKVGPKKLDIYFEQKGADVHIVIEDNGIGRAASDKLKNTKPQEHASFASGAIDERARLISQTMGQRVTVELEDKVDDEGTALGTRVVVTIADRF